jgi:hypothetical protein
MWVGAAAVGLSWTLALAGGGARPPESRTIPVAIASYTIDFSGSGPYLCDDGQSVLVESLGGQVRLTREGQTYPVERSTSGAAQVLWNTAGNGMFALTLGGVRQRCRPAEVKVQFYRCQDTQILAVAQAPQAVSLNLVRTGQRPDLSGWLAKAADGLYQNSEWTWQPASGQVRYHGKAVVMGCQAVPKA